MKTHTQDEALAFAERQGIWAENQLAALAAAIRRYAEEPNGRGQPQTAKVYLRDVPEHAEAIAAATLAAVVAGIVRDDGLTTLATGVAREAAKACGKKPDSNERAVAVGYWLVSAVCDVTGAARIENKFADRPNKVEGGVRLEAAYELIPVDGKFLADAAEFGAAGMPTYSKDPLAPWASQNSCEDHDAGMVHDAGRQMAGISADSAPELFGAVNAAQAAEFRVNPVTADIVLKYDPAKAQAWLADNVFRPQHYARELAKYTARGLDADSAKERAEQVIQRMAKDAARL